MLVKKKPEIAGWRVRGGNRKKHGSSDTERDGLLNLACRVRNVNVLRNMSPGFALDGRGDGFVVHVEVVGEGPVGHVRFGVASSKRSDGLCVQLRPIISTTFGPPISPLTVLDIVLLCAAKNGASSARSDAAWWRCDARSSAMRGRVRC